MDSCYITPKEDMHKGAYIIADPHKGLRDGALLFDAAQEELARRPPCTSPSKGSPCGS